MSNGRHDSTALQVSNAATVLQSDELRVAAARLLAAQAMVRQGYMPDAIRSGPVSGWPSPSASEDEPSGPSMAPSGSNKRVRAAGHSVDITLYLLLDSRIPFAGL